MNMLEQAHQSQSSALRFEQLATNLSELYVNHHRWLVKLLSRKLSCPHSAADIAQDTFVKLLGKSAPIQIQEPRAYLTTIAHGLMVNHIRRRDLEREYLNILSALPASEQPSTESKMIIIETIHQIDMMLEGLPSKARNAYLLLQLEGLSYAEIASQLGVTTRSVTNYIAKAALHCAVFKKNHQK